MSSRVKRFGWRTKGAFAVTLSLLVAFGFSALNRSFPLAVFIGVRPLQAEIALGLGAGVACMGVLSDKESRKATLATSVPTLVRLVVWWCGLTVSLALVAFASWKVWDVTFGFASILAGLKTYSVFSYIKQDYQWSAWQPFAGIIGVFVAMIVAVGVFLARPNIPPPIQVALRMYANAPVPGVGASRLAPDLSGGGFTLNFQGDLDLGGMPVSFFSYSAQDGSRVDLYLATISFPAPLGSSGVSGPSGWQVKQSGLYLRTGNAPTHFMVVGSSKLDVNRAVHTYAFAPAI